MKCKILQQQHFATFITKLFVDTFTL